MRIYFNQLENLALNYAVSQVEKKQVRVWKDADGCARALLDSDGVTYSPAYLWEQGAKIIEREKISIEWHEGQQTWRATPGKAGAIGLAEQPLVAAMRAYINSAAGDSFIEIPDELYLPKL